MPDHLHLLIRGTADTSAFKPAMTLIRQRTALVCRHVSKNALWQDGYFERVLRPSDDLCLAIEYIRNNPIALSPEGADYPFVWCAPGHP